MGGGNAIEQARETIDGMDDQQLAAASSAYRDLIAKGFRRRRPARECALTQRMRLSSAPCRCRPSAARLQARSCLPPDACWATAASWRDCRQGGAGRHGRSPAGSGRGRGDAEGYQRWRKHGPGPARGFVRQRRAGLRGGHGAGRRAWRSRGRAPPQHGDGAHHGGRRRCACQRQAVHHGQRRASAPKSWAAMRRCCASRTDSSCGLARRACAGSWCRTRGGGRRGEGCGHASPRTWARWRERVGRLPARPAGVRAPGRPRDRRRVRRPGAQRRDGQGWRRAAGADPHARRPRAFRPPVGVVRRPAARQRLAPGGRRAAGARRPAGVPGTGSPVERQALPAPKAIPPATASRPAKPGACPRTPRGIRNNNPGNIQKGVGFSGEIEGNDPALPRATPEDGIRAVAVNLLTYQRQHGLDTVKGILNRAPPSENDTGAYVQTVSRALGLRPTSGWT